MAVITVPVLLGQDKDQWIDVYKMFVCSAIYMTLIACFVIWLTIQYIYSST